MSFVDELHKYQPSGKVVTPSSVGPEIMIETDSKSQITSLRFFRFPRFPFNFYAKIGSEPTKMIGTVKYNGDLLPCLLPQVGSMEFHFEPNFPGISILFSSTSKEQQTPKYFSLVQPLGPQ